MAASNSNKSKGNLKASGKKESNLAASNKGGAASQTANEYDYNFRVVVVGDESVGKSSLILRYTENTFTEEFISSIGADYVRVFYPIRCPRDFLLLRFTSLSLSPLPPYSFTLLLSIRKRALLMCAERR